MEPVYERNEYQPMYTLVLNWCDHIPVEFTEVISCTKNINSGKFNSLIVLNIFVTLLWLELNNLNKDHENR